MSQNHPGQQYNPYTESWHSDEQAEAARSKRFGRFAYMAPIAYWPTLDSVAKKYGFGNYNKKADGGREFKYGRTGRTLAEVYPQAGERISFKAADAALDNMTERTSFLDRVDPNRYHYNMEGLGRSASPITGMDAETIQQPKSFIPTHNIYR